MTIQLRPDEFELLLWMIDRRDAAHLAGRTTDVFQVAEFNGGKSVLFTPGRTEGRDVPSATVSRLQTVDVFHVIKWGAKGFTFDLVDDIRDRLEQLRLDAGQPTRLGELEAAKERAEALARETQAQVVVAARARSEKRHAFAERVGRGARRLASVGLFAFYVVVVTLGGYVLSANLSLALILAIVLVGGAIGLADWLLHIDGFALAAGLERRVTAKVDRWLESFDAEP